jgi:hypothetical protein
MVKYKCTAEMPPTVLRVTVVWTVGTEGRL